MRREGGWELEEGARKAEEVEVEEDEDEEEEEEEYVEEFEYMEAVDGTFDLGRSGGGETGS